ncbi:diguanylate cyclase [Scytonema sp. UIC 10036]|uniref:diguanylate cyclase n=1 Tax=Scytonema sp. UIC 10036 TaxID=2304196 RepID=UPI0012DA30D9|nr:diguanylate cyclase [Scytonema sp. UIC 10036]MUG91549.1 diguanylate cyclase [Scytonema sp. UIC 10036]
MILFKPENYLILVVDDMCDNLQIIATLLEQVGYKVTHASNGMEALKLLQVVKPHLILLDLMMPEMNGLEVCEKLKADPEFAEIPIIFLTASNQQEHLLQAFKKGAVDYITKPFEALELFARVRTHLELKYAREELKKLLHQQKELIQELERLAHTDSLTGVWNRRYLFTLVDQEFNRSLRYHRPFAVLMIDIDHFKKINDTYGHTIGDEVLIVMAQTVLNCLRSVDFFGRIGGEEFMAFLPETDIDAAVATSERIRKTFEKLVISAQGQLVSITLSIGVATHKLGDETVNVIIQRADKALYQAKNLGRNQVVADT